MAAQAAPPVVIVLAAGEGTRMKSQLPKVLHAFAGRTMLGHVLAAAAPLDASFTAVVVGHGSDAVSATLPNDVVPVHQAQRLGTGHAVRLALEAVPASSDGPVVVVPGDAPLLTSELLRQLLDAHGDAAATLLTSVVVDPTGYGRVVRDADAAVLRVVEQKDATAEELAITEVATSVYAFDQALLRDAVGRLSTANAQGEEYLPDVVGIFAAEQRPIRAVVAPAELTAGVNDRVQLASAHRWLNGRLLNAHMQAGVRVVDPETTWVDVDVHLAADVTLRPSVELFGHTRVASGATIGPDVTLTDTTVGSNATISRTVGVSATIGPDVTVGPFAYLRPGTVLADGAHIGTFVELKNSNVGAGSKVPHLSYVGDADIGVHTNIGAATVFVNYDGVTKRRSRVGDHARTGADNMFVAPVVVGDGAYTAAGSVITQDVPPGAMGVARGQQRNVAGWVQRRRAGTPAADAAERAQAQADGED